MINFSSMVILVPLCEEFFFRELALRAYEKARSPLFATIFTAVLFSIYHLDFYQFISLMIFSFIVARAVQAFDSWWIAVTTHAMHNGFIFFLYSWVIVNQNKMPNEVENPISLQIGLLGLICAISTFCLMMYWFKNQEKKRPKIPQKRKPEKIFTPSLTIYIFICSILMWT